MTRVSAPEQAPARPEDSPIAWFGELLLAIERGAYGRASEAQGELARLGWAVTRCQQRQKGGVQ